MKRLTVKEEAVGEIKILRSRFIAIVSPCLNEESFEKTLLSIKEKYPKASHYCYGYRCGNKEGYSDDGEPSRSVGLPLLSLLRNRGLEDVLLVVVRYFGGTKLGLGRLKRTYLSVAENVLEAAPLYEEIEGMTYVLESGYADYDKIKKNGLLQGYRVHDEQFSSSVRFSLSLDATLKQSFEEALPPEVTILSRQEGDLILRSVPHDTKQ